MEIFRKALECALAHEKNKTAIRTRRHYKKQIDILERTITGLKSVIENKNSEMGIMGKTIEKLNSHLDNKKSEIVGLEGELRQVKTALEDKDKVNSMVLQKLTVQSNLFISTRKQLGVVTKENEDQSHQIWKMLEENCYLNKRILELDLEVHSLEALVDKLSNDNEKSEQRAVVLSLNLKHSQDAFELKCRDILDISVREQQLQATVFNLRGELDQWTRNSQRSSDIAAAGRTSAAAVLPSVPPYIQHAHETNSPVAGTIVFPAQKAPSLQFAPSNLPSESAVPISHRTYSLSPTPAISPLVSSSILPMPPAILPLVLPSPIPFSPVISPLLTPVHPKTYSMLKRHANPSFSTHYTQKEKPSESCQQSDVI